MTVPPAMNAQHPVAGVVAATIATAADLIVIIIIIVRVAAAVVKRENAHPIIATQMYLRFHRF